MSFNKPEDGPDPHGVQGHFQALTDAIEKRLKDTASNFKLEMTRGDLTVRIEMDPVDGRVWVSIRQYPKDRANPGSEVKKGFVVDLNMNQLPNLKPGYELTRLIPENTELAERLCGKDLWKNGSQQP